MTGPEIPRGLGVSVDRKTGESLSCATHEGRRIAGEIKDRVIQNYSACVTKGSVGTELQSTWMKYSILFTARRLWLEECCDDQKN